MYRRFFVLALFALSSATVVPAQTGSIAGSVADAETNRRLEGANVIIQGAALGSTADSNGRFVIANIAPGKVTVVATYIGYNASKMTVDVKAGSLSEIELLLSPEILRVLPVIVTANAAKERETPVTFAELPQSDIKERYITQDVPAVLSELPSIVSYSENGNDMGYTHLNLRGFDERRIAVMVNGVPQNDPEDHIVYWIDMPDLLAFTQNIQVMRGAGSDFYGPPAIGGSINFVTTPISPKPGITLTTDFGFQTFGDEDRTVLNSRKYGIALNSGLVADKYSFFGNFSTVNSSGYRQHSWIDVSSYFIGLARFDKTMTTRIHIYGGPLQDGLAYNGIPKFYNTDLRLRRLNYNYFTLNGTEDTVTYTTFRKPQENEMFSQPHYELLHEWNLSPTVKLFNTVFYIQGDGYFDYDGDWIWTDPIATQWFHEVVGYDTSFGSTNFNSMLLRGFVGNKQVGWLPRIEIDHGKGKLTLGGEMRFHRSIHWGKIQYASVYPADYNPDFHFYEYRGEKDMLSLYGHEILHLNDRTTAMIDLQVAYDRYGFNSEKFLNTSFDVKYLFVNPRLGINYNFTEKLNGYISLSSTSREPRLGNLYTGEEAYDGQRPNFEAAIVNGNAVYDFSKPLAKPEHLIDLECGIAYKTTSNRLTANFFWMEFTDELINSGKLDIFGVPVTGNAERTRHLGIELTAEQKISGGLDVSGNLTFSRNRLIRYRAYDESTGALTDFSGNPISGFPDMLANVRLAYHWSALAASISGKHVGAFYTDNTKNEHHRVDAYTVCDLDGSYEFSSAANGAAIGIHGKVRNLFNVLYFAGGQGYEFFPAAERSYYISLTFGF